VIICAIVPAYFSWPQFPVVEGASPAEWEKSWDRIVQHKVDNPWFDYGRHFPGGGNEAKRTFRVVVPLVAHLTHTGLSGVRTTTWALQGVLLVCLLLAAERACHDRATALAAALVINGTYVGTSVWRDACHWFDNCSHAFMALALVARRPWLACSAVLLAAFTDERALIAVPAILVFHFLVGSTRATQVGIAASIPLYFLVRIVVTYTQGIVQPTAGIGEFAIVANNLENAAFGLWFALEGGWIVVAAGVCMAFAAGRRGLAVCLLGTTLLPAFAAFGVLDFTRSATYAFPAVLAALALHREQAGTIFGRLSPLRITVSAALVSLVVPNVFVMANVFVETSVPVRFLINWLRSGS
jgi:hypothetical protein